VADLAGCLVGTWMLSGAGNLNLGIGDAWVIASSLFWALHVLFVGRDGRPDRRTFPGCVRPVLRLRRRVSVLGALTETITLEGIQRAAVPISTPAFISVGFAYTGQVVGQRYAARPTRRSSCRRKRCSPRCSAFLLMGDRLSTTGMVGCALIFICIVAVQMMPMLARGRVERA
jgi:drug/metabolite transporter (DMT)-like permease